MKKLLLAIFITLSALAGTYTLKAGTRFTFKYIKP